MYKDLLVNEVRKRREKLMEKYNYDVDKIYSMIKKREEKVKDKIVSEIVVIHKVPASDRKL